MEIKNITIIGAGAMGAAYAAMFSDAGAFNVAFAAAGERYEQLQNSSLTVNTKPYTIQIIHPGKSSKPADLVIVALKHRHLVDALGDIKALTGPDTIILSVMNGLESEVIIGSACGMDKMVHAIAVGIDAVREGDCYTYANPGKIIFGDINGNRDPRRLERLKAALTRAAIPNEIPGDMKRVIWWKFMINVGINQASAVLRAPYGIFQTSPDARTLMKALMMEVIELAEKVQVDLSTRDLDEWMNVLATLSPSGKTSMLQDIEAKRKTEVEIFGGKVVSLGEKYQMQTPANTTVFTIIKALEAQNASETAR